MKNYKRPKEAGAQKMSVGGASLIMIFSILCLTIFAALSMTTALAEKAAAQRYADTTSEYYTADAKAREFAIAFAKVSMNAGGSHISVIMEKDAAGRLKIVSFTQEENSEWIADDKIELLI